MSRKRRRFQLQSPVLLRCALAIGAVGCVHAAVTESGLGGSPIPIGAGARPLGMGGAFAAVADDASASTWNPAGMVQLERFEASASLGFYDRRTDAATTDDASLDHVSLIAPFFAFDCQQTVGLSWQRQYDFTRKIAYFDHQVDDLGGGFLADNQDGVDMRMSGSYASLGLSYAIEPLPGLAFGVTGNTWADYATGASGYRRDSVLDSRLQLTMDGIPLSDESTDQRRHTDVSVTNGYNLIAGGWWQIDPWWTVALVAKPRYHLDLDIHARERTQNTNNLNPNDPTDPGNSVTTTSAHDHATFQFPSSVTAGVAWRWLDRDTVSCDLTWTHWADYRIEQQGITQSPVNSDIPPEKFADGWSARLGYEHLMMFEDAILVLRGGALYEGLPGGSQVADPSLDTQAHAVVDDYYGVTAGFSVVTRRFVYDLGAQLRYGHDVGAGQETSQHARVDIIATVVRVGVVAYF